VDAETSIATVEATSPPVPAGIEDAERVVFLALACELARDRSVLVIDDGTSALSAVASRIGSTNLAALSEAESGAWEFAVTDVRDPAADLSQIARAVDPESGFAVARFPNDFEFAATRDSFVTGFGRAVTLYQQEWVTSSLFGEQMARHDQPARAVQSSVRKLAASEPGDERFHVVVAAHGPMPKLPPQLAVASGAEQREQLHSQSIQIQTLSDRLELASEDLALRSNDLSRERETTAALEAELATALEELATAKSELEWYAENRLPVRAQVEEREWALEVLSVWRRAVKRIESLRK
jgi:hypothetical protein